MAGPFPQPINPLPPGAHIVLWRGGGETYGTVEEAYWAGPEHGWVITFVDLGGNRYQWYQARDGGQVGEAFDPPEKARRYYGKR